MDVAFKKKYIQPGYYHTATGKYNLIYRVWKQPSSQNTFVLITRFEEQTEQSNSNCMQNVRENTLNSCNILLFL